MKQEAIMRRIIKEEIKENPITREEIENWGNSALGNNYVFDWIAEIFNGDYEIDNARRDILSFRKSFKERIEDEKGGE